MVQFQPSKSVQDNLNKLGLKPLKADTDSSSGLYNIAYHSGLKDDADKIMKSHTGESTKEIFSGGFITDIFDVLNSLQYGVTGMLKGKGFSEGVRTRQSFSDKDALGDNGLPGVIAGIGLDILVDPLTYIAPATILRKIPGFTKGTKLAKEAIFGKQVSKAIGDTGKTFQELEGGSKLGKYSASKFAHLFGADPIFAELWNRRIKNIGVATSNISDVSKKVAKFGDDLGEKLITRDEIGRIKRVKIGELSRVLNPEQFQLIQKAWNNLNNLGKEGVDLGIVPKGKFEETFDTYMKGAFTEYETAVKKNPFNTRKVGIKPAKKRLDLTKEEFAKVAEEKGQIANPAYLLFKSTFDLMKDVENAKMFKKIDETFSSAKEIEGFKRLPDTQRLGALKNKYVPEQMFDYIQETVKPSDLNLGKKLIGAFKFNKVILNPSTHIRNMASNRMLNWWKLGIGPWRVDLDIKTMKAIREGDSNKWIKEAKPLGYGADTFASQEIKHMLDDPQAALFGKGVGSKWSKIKTRLAGVYQGEENYAKLSAYIAQREKGFKPEEAWKAAESATFNYAQVTPFVRQMRTSLWGMPFITFGVKAAPVVAETALKHPRRISVVGKIKTAIENQSDIAETDREKASEAPWIKDGFYIKLPFKDKDGRSAYFDMTYILPFGDLVSGQILQRQVGRETGVVESIPASILSKNPVLNFLKEISRNQDFSGRKLWRDSDSVTQQTTDLMRHVSKTFLPPLVADQIPGGYDSKGERVQSGFAKSGGDKTGTQQRNLMQEMLKVVGAKIQPVDADIQEQMQEWNRKKGLTTLLRDNNKVKEFSSVYVPKK